VRAIATIASLVAVRVGSLSKRWLVSLLIAGVCLSLSGCFALRGFQWSTQSAKAGKAVSANLTVAPAVLPGPPTAPDSHRDIPFTLIGLSYGDYLTLGHGSTWDAKGHFNGPKPLIPDQALADHIISSGECDITDFGQNTVPLVDLAHYWRAVRTEAPVNDHGRIAATALERIKLRVKKSAPTTIDNVLFLTGAWQDDGDGVPEDSNAGDSIYCNAHLNTTVGLTAAK
jgi:hypothetical protein